MKVKLRRDRMARVERFRKWKKERKIGASVRSNWQRREDMSCVDQGLAD